MGSLNINYIKKPDITKAGHLYSDLYLDMENDYKVRANFSKESTQLIDIKVAYDEDAVKNSLNALLNTTPGQRLLLPEYGVNIQRYIFSPISESNAYVIGEFIKDAIEKWEPRVSVEGITIKTVVSDNRYDIFLDLFIPSLGKRVGFLSELVQGEGINFK